MNEEMYNILRGAFLGSTLTAVGFALLILYVANTLR